MARPKGNRPVTIIVAIAAALAAALQVAPVQAASLPAAPVQAASLPAALVQAAPIPAAPVQAASLPAAAAPISARGGLQVASSILSFFNAIKGCVSAAVAGNARDCLTGGPTVRDVLQELDKLNKRLNGLEGRLGEIQDGQLREALQSRLAVFAPIEDNDNEAERALVAHTRCLVALDDSQSTCNDVWGRARPTSEAVAVNRDRFLEVMDRLSGLNIPALASGFAGSREGPRTGLAEAAWDYFRTAQHNAAGVDAQSAVRQSNSLSVITPDTSRGMNRVLEYYSGLIVRYAFLQGQAAGLRSAEDFRRCTRPLEICRRDAVTAIQREADEYVKGSTGRSVQWALDRFRLPEVRGGEIAVAPAGGYLRYIASAEPGLPQAISLDHVRQIGNTLAAYSGTDRIIRRIPSAFPPGGAYTTIVPVRHTQWIIYNCIWWATCPWSYTTGRNPVSVFVFDAWSTDNTCMVHATPTNEPVTWNNEFWTWARANPQNQAAHDLSDGNWWIDFQALWHRMGGNTRVSLEYDQFVFLGPELGDPPDKYGWGGALKCLGAQAASRVGSVLTLRDDRFPLFRAAGT